jgi:site-specific DNA-methyltransferase (adenine-specific)
MRISIYNKDCLSNDGMKSLTESCIDMILCDLPYGVTKNDWDKVIPMDKMWAEYKRIIKDRGAICLFANQPFTSELVMSNKKEFRYSLVWEKNKFSDFLNAKRKPMKIHEDILVFYKKQPTYNPQYTQGEPYVRWNKQGAVDNQTNYGKHKENYINNTDGKRLPTSVLKYNRVERPLHPTQKPIDLCAWLINTYTVPGETVLDNCFGSASTAIACLDNGRSFIGFELSGEYFDMSKERINEHIISKGLKVIEKQEDEHYVVWDLLIN